MADAEVFVANALLSIAGIGVFTILFIISYLEKNKLFQYMWLSGIVLVMTYAFACQRIAFNAVGLYDLRDLAFTVLDVLMWVFMGIFLLTGALIVKICGEMAWKVMTGEQDYEHKEK